MEYNSRRNNYELLPDTITLDTDNRNNTVIRKNDLALITATKCRKREPKRLLLNMVACKTVSEYKRNQEKIKKFCVEEKAEVAREQEARAKQARSAPL